MYVALFFSSTAGVLSGLVGLSSLIILSTYQTSALVNITSEHLRLFPEEPYDLQRKLQWCCHR